MMFTTKKKPTETGPDTPEAVARRAFEAAEALVLRYRALTSPYHGGDLPPSVDAIEFLTARAGLDAAERDLALAEIAYRRERRARETREAAEAVRLTEARAGEDRQLEAEALHLADAFAAGLAALSSYRAETKRLGGSTPDPLFGAFAEQLAFVQEQVARAGRPVPPQAPARMRPGETRVRFVKLVHDSYNSRIQDPGAFAVLPVKVAEDLYARGLAVGA